MLSNIVTFMPSSAKVCWTAVAAAPGGIITVLLDMPTSIFLVSMIQHHTALLALLANMMGFQRHIIWVRSSTCWKIRMPLRSVFPLGPVP